MSPLPNNVRGNRDADDWSQPGAWRRAIGQACSPRRRYAAPALRASPARRCRAASDSGFDQPFGDQTACDQLAVPRRLAAGEAHAPGLDEQLELQSAHAACAGTPPTARTTTAGTRGSTTRSSPCAAWHRRPPAWAGTPMPGMLAARSRAAGAPSCSSASASGRVWSPRRGPRAAMEHPAVARRVARIQAEPVAEQIARMLRRAPATQVVGEAQNTRRTGNSCRDTSSSEAAGKI